jgi:hypothetical protein
VEGTDDPANVLVSQYSMIQVMYLQSTIILEPIIPADLIYLVSPAAGCQIPQRE